MSLFQKRVTLWKLVLPFVLLLIAVAFMADSCGGSQTTASNNNANTAADKWGSSPNITNYYEYLQLKQIYEARDNPQLVLNAYLYSEQTGQLTCMGKVKGFGVPYGTEWSPPASGTQGSVPEPNALYPSQDTSADWIQLIDPKTGKTSIAFVEPNLIITSQTLPCTPLHG
jgi:hypothetical protein